MTAKEFAPGAKTHRDENFPVASRLIHPRHRGAILSFYRFARAADDVADDPSLSEAEKISRLDAFEQTLLGENDSEPAALPLRAAVRERDLTPRHAQDLLIAFRRDAAKQRYANWGELTDYCRFSAMPVGRFVLDVHGESRETWPASDALCQALQIINHLQDCGADYRNLGRVYIPLDALAAHGVTAEALAQEKAAPGLRRCIQELAAKTETLLIQPLAPAVQDFRLALEIGVIERAARALVKMLQQRDPLSERVHLSKAGFAAIGLAALGSAALRPFKKASATGLRSGKANDNPARRL